MSQPQIVCKHKMFLALAPPQIFDYSCVNDSIGANESPEFCISRFILLFERRSNYVGTASATGNFRPNTN